MYNSVLSFLFQPFSWIDAVFRIIVIFMNEVLPIFSYLTDNLTFHPGILYIQEVIVSAVSARCSDPVAADSLKLSISKTPASVLLIGTVCLHCYTSLAKNYDRRI